MHHIIVVPELEDQCALNTISTAPLSTTNLPDRKVRRIHLAIDWFNMLHCAI